MSQPRTGVSQKGQPLHYSVGAVIKNEKKYILIDRKNPPLGYAGLAGHVDENETPEQALWREVKEESGLTVLETRLLFEEEVEDNRCKRGVNTHYWYLYECSVSGEVQWNPHETKSIGWYTKNEIRKLPLEPVWDYWFRKLQII